MIVKFSLNYVLPDGQFIRVGFFAHNDPSLLSWLSDMVESNPDTIFFFTTDSTDIWED